MADTSDFKNGLVINHKNNLVKITEFLHVKPGKGGAFVRTKLKNIKTGQVVEETFRSGEKIDIIRLEALQFNYLYKDADDYYFMNNETFEQISLSKETIGSCSDFLVENTETTIVFHDESPVEIRLPVHMNYEIVETDPGEKGNTAQGGTKPAKIETGIVLQVPLFVQIGDVIRVDTREKKYIERIKK
tara:strand:- start:1489 stop:2052 length:564 start_codon:yes stop_codon:yes gene_type:complete